MGVWGNPPSQRQKSNYTSSSSSSKKEHDGNDHTNEYDDDDDEDNESTSQCRLASNTSTTGGATKSFSNCDELLNRLEKNDPILTSIIILPMKSFSDTEMNRISYIMDTTTEKLHLRSLNASGHSVSNKALYRFGRSIISLCNRGFSSLVSIAIGDSTMGDEGVAAFIDGLTSLQDTVTAKCTITHIDFSYKDMTLVGFMSMASLCYKCPTITHVNISKNCFTYIKDVEIPPEIKDDDVIFQHVVDLDLTDCQIDSKFAKRILPFFSTINNDGNNGASSNHSAGGNSTDGDSDFLTIEKEHQEDDAEEITSSSKQRRGRTIQDMFKKRKKAKSFRTNDQNITRMIKFHSNPSIGDKGLKEILKLSHCNGIYVSDCNISDTGIMFLTTASSTALQDIHTLDISNNRAITASGMTILGDALKRKFISVLLPNLQHLNISNNELIGKDGIQALLMGLVGRRLLSCDFSEINCGGPGAILAIVGSQMDYCCSIQSLRLYNNKIGSNGFYKISEILAEILISSDIHTLDLAGNNAGQASVVVLLKAVLDAIERTMTRNRRSILKLKCLVIGGNHGGFDVEATVKQIHALRPDIDIARDKKV